MTRQELPAEPVKRLAYRRAVAIQLVIVAAVLCVLLAWASEEIWEAVVERSGLFRVDLAVHDWFARNRVPIATVPLAALSFIGGKVPMSILVALLTLLLCGLRRSWQPLVVMAIAMAGSLAMTTIGKDLLGRARPPFEQAVPPLESSASFPSGHSLNSFVAAFVLLALSWRLLRSAVARGVAIAGTCAFVLCMGFSRVYLGHHWPSDVLVAWSLGAAWVLSLLVARHIWSGERERRRARRPSATPPVLPGGAA